MIDIIRLGISFYLIFAGLFGVDDFNLLRWIVFLGGIYLLFILLVGEKVTNSIKFGYLVFFILLIIIFNPIAPIYLYNINIWKFIDIFCGILLFIEPILINNTLDKNSEEYLYHFRKNY